MSEPFIGEIRCVGFNWAPKDWELCNGQTMSISQNTALFSLLGTSFGGDGKTNFQLPNLNVNTSTNTNANTIRIAGGNMSLFGKTATTQIPVSYTIPANVVRVILENP